MLRNLIGVLFDGIAYGSLLFVISIGLSVTMGLMNFVNLAHGAFAMLGGYACVVLMTHAGVPFLATLPVAFAVAAVAGIVLEVFRQSPINSLLHFIRLHSQGGCKSPWKLQIDGAPCVSNQDIPKEFPHLVPICRHSQVSLIEILLSEELFCFKLPGFEKGDQIEELDQVVLKGGCR